MAQFGLAYGAALVAIIVLDGLWLGVVSGDLYQREMGTLMADTFRVAPMIVFYLLYPAALVYLAVGVEPAGWGEATLRGAVLGLAAYGAYDLTNLAIVRDWPLKVSLIDLAWGGLLSAAAAASAYAASWARA
ncbi:MAG: DUF2177 family protein [Caldimonas sp.]